MVRHFIISLVLLGFAWPSLADTNFIYPLPTWHVSTQQGEEISSGLYHMGVDVGGDLPAGTPVYAAADGIVREAQERSQFGLVVLLEHTDIGVSLYGHLDPTDIRVTPGQTVAMGDVIGVLGDTVNNGGWPVHLHFGINKAAYTGEWIYYGHVHDPAEAANWYDPITFIPEHLLADIWKPTFIPDLENGAVIGNSLSVTGTIGDKGSTIKSVRIKVSSDNETWQTISNYANPTYVLSSVVDISDYADGKLYVKIIARDWFNNKTVVNRTVTKDTYLFTVPMFVAMKSGSSNAEITQWSYGGSVTKSFFPYRENTAKRTYLAVENDNIITARGNHVKIFSATGENINQLKINQFDLPDIRIGALTVSNDQIIIADKNTYNISSYSMIGELIWTISPPNFLATDMVIKDGTIYLCGNYLNKAKVMTMDTSGTIVNQFNPFRHSSTITSCNLAIFNNQLVVTTNGNDVGTAKVFSLTGAQIGQSFQPFGSDFTGSIDVTALSDGTVLFSQASRGQAWVKGYSLDAEPVVLFTERVYEEDFNMGAKIYAW
ncbi:MAG: peptidoglycan DD-metalloendopeptidase family protein [Patescibacteria group bacterium]